jgi:hypothetical protein
VRAPHKARGGAGFPIDQLLSYAGLAPVALTRVMRGLCTSGRPLVSLMDELRVFALLSWLRQTSQPTVGVGVGVGCDVCDGRPCELPDGSGANCLIDVVCERVPEETPSPSPTPPPPSPTSSSTPPAPTPSPTALPPTASPTRSRRASDSDGCAISPGRHDGVLRRLVFLPVSGFRMVGN